MAIFVSGWFFVMFWKVTNANRSGILMGRKRCCTKDQIRTSCPLQCIAYVNSSITFLIHKDYIWCDDKKSACFESKIGETLKRASNGFAFCGLRLRLLFYCYFYTNGYSRTTSRVMKEAT